MRYTIAMVLLILANQDFKIELWFGFLEKQLRRILGFYKKDRTSFATGLKDLEDNITKDKNEKKELNEKKCLPVNPLFANVGLISSM